ncbi:MAG: peptide deformylase [Phycisphaerales bacterium]|nr:peptide deformylase [Planctomycetota bacterium]MBL6997597.1 peptide deformylase [Phycisphaerales bacterium]
MPVDPQSLSLHIYPSATLLHSAQEVDPSDPNVQAVGQRMIEMMFEHSGVGLAAPQVGLSWRVFVTRDSSSEEDEIKGCVWINPRLEVICDELEVDEEGCLSLPEIRADIRRPSGIRISGFDCNGKPQEMTSNDFMARVWQHENDHLDGILILDKMSAMGRLVNRRLIRNLERAQ